MSRELRDLEAKRGGRGLLRSGKVGLNDFRGNAGTLTAQHSLQRDAKRTEGRARSNFGAAMSGSASARSRQKKLARRYERIGVAQSYLGKRSKRNQLRGGLSYGDKSFEEIEEKGRGGGMIRGGSKRLIKIAARKGRLGALGAAENRTRGRAIGMGYSKERGYASLPRTGKYS
jgi:hypothetical protein